MAGIDQAGDMSRKSTRKKKKKYVEYAINCLVMVLKTSSSIIGFIMDIGGGGEYSSWDILWGFLGSSPY